MHDDTDRDHQTFRQRRVPRRSALLWAPLFAEYPMGKPTHAGPTTVRCRLLAASRVDPTGPIPARAASVGPALLNWSLCAEFCCACRLERRLVFADVGDGCGSWVSGCERRRVCEWMSTCRTCPRVPFPCGLHPPVATLTSVRLDSRPQSLTSSG